MTDEGPETTQGRSVVQFQAPRLPYHPVIEERFGVDRSSWKALVEAIFPAAESVDSVVMALAYCKARSLDVFKRPVHIVPVWDSKRSRMVETVWPGIAEIRTTAMRTAQYAGCDATEWGPVVELELDGVHISVPEWGRMTAYRLVGNHRSAFVGPEVYWIETYATAKRDTRKPNSMWHKRPRGQLEKCVEAAALRKAFPEELGNVYAAEEMEGRSIDGDSVYTAEVVDSRSLEAGFGDEMDRTFRRPAVEPAPEVEAEVVDIEKAPTEPTPEKPKKKESPAKARPAKTDDAPAAEPDKARPDSASEAPPPAAESSGQTITDGHAAEDEEYLIAGENPDASGLWMVYQNGCAIETVAEIPAEIKTYRGHPPQEAGRDGCEGEQKSPTTSDASPARAVAPNRVTEQLAAASDWLGARQALVTYGRSDDGQAADEARFDAVLRAAWDRYQEFGEAEAKRSPPFSDVLLFRLWMRFADPAPSKADIKAGFTKLVRQPSWTRQTEAEADRFGQEMRAAEERGGG